MKRNLHDNKRGDAKRRNGFMEEYRTDTIHLNHRSENKENRDQSLLYPKQKMSFNHSANLHLYEQIMRKVTAGVPLSGAEDEFIRNYNLGQTLLADSQFPSNWVPGFPPRYGAVYANGLGNRCPNGNGTVHNSTVNNDNVGGAVTPTNNNEGSPNEKPQATNTAKETSSGEDEVKTVDEFANLRLEKNKTYELPVPDSVKTEAQFKLQLDLMEVRELRRQSERRYVRLEREAENRYYTTVGLQYPPDECYPSGYSGKTGKKSKEQILFENRSFSYRRMYYESHPSRTNLAVLKPKNQTEVDDLNNNNNKRRKQDNNGQD